MAQAEDAAAEGFRENDAVDYALVLRGSPAEGWDWPAIKEAGDGDAFCKQVSRLMAEGGAATMTGPRIRTALDTLADGRVPTNLKDLETKLLEDVVRMRRINLNGNVAAKRPSPATKATPPRRAIPAATRPQPTPQPRPQTVASTTPVDRATTEGAFDYASSGTEAGPTFGGSPEEVDDLTNGIDARVAARSAAIEKATRQAEEAERTLKSAGIPIDADPDGAYEAAFIAAVSRALRDRLHMNQYSALIDVIRTVSGDELDQWDYQGIIDVVYAGRERHMKVGTEFDGGIAEFRRKASPTSR